MMTRFLPIAALALGWAGVAQAGFTTTSFQDVGPTAPNTYYDAFNYNAMSGQSIGLTNPTTSYPNGQFTSGGNTFFNDYQSAYGGYYSGTAVSDQVTSSVTPYVNQKTTPDVNYEYISAAGMGVNGAGSPFAVVTSGSVVNLAAGTTASSAMVTNSLYDELSMINGDTFASPFKAGNFFTLTVTGYSGLNETGSVTGSTSYNLADYTSRYPSQYYIQAGWYKLDLTPLGNAQSLVFTTFSNDDNSFGDAIPSLFDLGSLTTATPSAVPEPSSLVLCLCGIGIGSLAHRRLRSRNVPHSERQPC